MGYNNTPFEGGEVSFLQELLMEVLPHSNKYKNKSIRDSFFYGLCDMAEESTTHWIHSSLRDKLSDPYEVMEVYAGKLEEEYKDYISQRKDHRHRGGKISKFQVMDWDKEREWVNEKGVRIRYSVDGRKISLKAFTTGMVGNLSDFDSLMFSLRLEYKDITIPQFFRLVSYFQSSRGKDAHPASQTYFKKFASVYSFQESLIVELGLEDKKSQSANLDEVDFFIS